jgi:hypothetical protein
VPVCAFLPGRGARSLGAGEPVAESLPPRQLGRAVRVVRVPHKGVNDAAAGLRVVVVGVWVAVADTKSACEVCWLLLASGSEYGEKFMLLSCRG